MKCPVLRIEVRCILGAIQLLSPFLGSVGHPSILANVLEKRSPKLGICDECFKLKNRIFRKQRVPFDEQLYGVVKRPVRPYYCCNSP